MRIRMYGTGEEREVDEASGSRMIARAQARRIRAGAPEPAPKATRTEPETLTKRKEAHSG